MTPMFEQYLQIKDDYPEALLFFRMGDFYELFFEDAEITARELQIALTSRHGNSETRIPMCGVPHHAVDAYLGQLLEKGYKVAICDQIEDPKAAKGLVKRAVTRVLTPGTVVEDSSLSAKTSNYLAAIIYNASKGVGAISWIDFSTGQWSGFQSKDEPTLWQWLMKVNPREIILPIETELPDQFSDLEGQPTRVPVGAYFDLAGGKDKILAAQGVASLDALDLADKPELVRACGALLVYLRQTQKQDMQHLGAFQPLNLGKFLILDEVTERNLELFRTLDGKKGKGTLRAVIDRTMTPMGGRLLEDRLRKPWRDLAPIQRTQACVQLFHQFEDFRLNMRGQLDQVYDLERLSTRIFLNRATPKDFVSLRQSLSIVPNLHDLLSQMDVNILSSDLKRLLEHWDSMDDMQLLLEKALVDSPPPTITEGGLFRQGFDAELDELLELTDHGEQKLQELLTQEREKHDLPKLKLGFNRVFGYYLELSRAVRDQVPDYYVRRQTLANSERYITPELKELEEKILGAAEQRKNLEYKLFQQLREQVANARPRFMFMAGSIAALDYWQALADAAACHCWTLPDVHAGPELEIKAGRHPVVEAVQGSANFIPNDLYMDPESRLLLITGPNMAGKSTVLRQSAIIMILAQMGAFVPATSARIGLADRIFSRVGASDNLAQGQSTFMVEMMETARILRQATKRSFIILDEIGRGTSTFDGLALAWAVVEELSKRAGRSIRTLFATHYHELTSLEGRIPGVRNYNIAVREYKGDIIFMRRLVPGPSDRSYGIEVAKLAGVPNGVVLRAREVLGDLEKAREDAGKLSSTVVIRQSLLPGLQTSCEPVEPKEVVVEKEHPVIDELRTLPVDTLSPLEALNLLHNWKQRIGNS